MLSETSGASYTFGCSYSTYEKGCQFKRSLNPKKYLMKKTKNEVAEKVAEKVFETVATFSGKIYEKLAPQAYRNQVRSFYVFQVLVSMIR